MFFFKRQEFKNQTTEDEYQGQQNTSYSLSPEILTISQDPYKPYLVQFDDPSWKQHLPSMKPLGLSILLNTCNFETEKKYADFYQFLRSEVAQSKNSEFGQEVFPIIPSRGCLCQLSRKIGLDMNTVSEYNLVHQFQSFRTLTSREPFSNRNNKMPGLKFPPPHQVSVLTRQGIDQSISLHSQGTADLVVDLCVDAWTGHDLTTLKPAEKKKCMEFYQRASLTSYCTTFAFKPLSTRANENLDRDPIEIPHQSSIGGKSYDLDSISVGSLDEEKLYQDASDTLKTLHSQSFLGMVQMQYQAMVDMVQFIDLLEKACIRFVHFSKENELRSRVFSEKMGLESGWNCHISLHSQADVEAATGIIYGEKDIFQKKFVNNTKSFSVPNKLNKDRSLDIFSWGDSCGPLLKSHDEDSLSSDVGSISSFLEYNNRAQLPAGIEKIRPHLDTMDNVPLLVSLFTDCTPDTTNEMLKILQENGEVVVTIGSSANYHNMRIFLTADASISLEPLYPQVCQKIPVMTAPTVGMGPTELSRHLVSLPVSVSMKREDDVSVYRAIIRSRRHVLAIRHGLQLWTSCCMFLSSLVMTSLFLSLPSPLTPPQMLIITSFYIPLLSTASFFSAYDSNISNISTGKNKNILFNKSSLWLSIWCYGSRFLIAFLAVSLSHFLSILELSSRCKTKREDTSCYETVHDQLNVITDTNMMFLVLYLVCTSFSFVSRTDHIWQYKIKRSWHICLVSGVIILVQSLYFLFSILNVETLFSVAPMWSWIILGACVPIQFCVNELVKRHEIKVNVRFQKRSRLDFNTKLGINSPF